MVKRIPTQLEKHGRVRLDDYYWLRERDNPEVIAYLNAENAYAEKEMAHTKGFEEKLFEEIKARFKQTDMSVPYKRDDYFYYTRYEEGKEYPIYARKRGLLEQPEEIMLDVNVLAQGHEFFSVGGSAVSSGQDILAYAVDTQGRRVHTTYFKNLKSGETLPDVLTEVTENLTWANDNKTLFYARQDATTLRAYQIWRHVLGTDPSHDQLVFQEDDETFVTYVFKTKTKKYLMVVSAQTVSQEYRYLDANDPYGDFEIFRDHLAVEERQRGLTQIRVVPWSDGEEHYLEFQEPAYRAHIGNNPELDTTVLRFEYTSMKMPLSICDYDMVTRQRTLLKQEEVLGGFNADNYVTERL